MSLFCHFLWVQKTFDLQILVLLKSGKRMVVQRVNRKKSKNTKMQQIDQIQQVQRLRELNTEETLEGSHTIRDTHTKLPRTHKTKY